MNLGKNIFCYMVISLTSTFICVSAKMKFPFQVLGHSMSKKQFLGPSKNWINWGRGRGGRGGCEMFLLERRDKPEKMELMLKWGWSLFFTTFSSITFTFSDLQSFELAMQDFHPYSHSSLVLKPGIIFTFLIRSGSQQKMLTALFNLVRNTKKIIWTIFFECQGKVFLCIEKILDKISQDQT